MHQVPAQQETGDTAGRIDHRQVINLVAFISSERLHVVTFVAGKPVRSWRWLRKARRRGRRAAVARPDIAIGQESTQATESSVTQKCPCPRLLQAATAFVIVAPGSISELARRCCIHPRS